MRSKTRKFPELKKGPGVHVRTMNDYETPQANTDAERIRRDRMGPSRTVLSKFVLSRAVSSYYSN